MNFSWGFEFLGARSRLTHAPGEGTCNAKRNTQLTPLFFAMLRDTLGY